MLKLDRIFNNEFATGHMVDSNPLNQFVMIDDMIMPIESLPEEYQQMVREARARGEDISFRTNG